MKKKKEHDFNDNVSERTHNCTHNDKIKTSHTSIEESAEGCSMRRVTEIQPVSAIKLLVEL